MKRKLTLYFEDTDIKEIQSESKRTDRSISWLLSLAWRLARRTIAETCGKEADVLRDMMENEE